MITPKINGKNATFGPCRLNHVHVFEKYKFDGDDGDGKYNCHILIPKTEKATVDAVCQAIETAKAEGKAGKWGNKIPKNYRDPLQDGDEKEGDEYAGMWYLNAKSSRKPYLLLRDKSVAEDSEDFYGGMWAIPSVGFFAYATAGGNGVGCALNGLWKYKDDDPLGGSGNSAKAAFDELTLDDDDDDM